MKNKLVLSVMAVLLFIFSACEDNDSYPSGAQVEVVIKNADGEKLRAESVYFFKGENPSFERIDSYQYEITDKYGVAWFFLDFDRLEIKEDETPLYFAVFYTADGEEKIARSSEITLKRGNTLRFEIRKK